MDFGWLNWLWIIPVLGLLVFVHELGHFVTARMNGIRVDEFGFGFPPRLFGIKRGGVIYSINAIPVGGFVRIYGENGENANDPQAFGSKAPWRRAIVLAAGSAMNVLLALLIFAILAMMGTPIGMGAVIQEVTPGTPAAAAELRPGDEITSVAGTEIVETSDLGTAVQRNLDREVPLVVERDGRQLEVRITPRSEYPSGQGPLGVVINAESQVIGERHNPLSALVVAAEQVVSVTAAMVRALGQIISGAVGLRDLAGPVGIAQVTTEVAEQGQFRLLMSWTALLSLNLFLVNMLPLPALDGGRLVFVLIEAIRGRKVAPHREAFVHAIGMLLLLTFLVVITFFDAQRIWEGRSILP